MNLDDEIRSTLHTRAEEAPAGVGLLDNVRTRARRRQYGRRAGMAGVIAAVGVGVSVTTPYVGGLLAAGPELAGSAGPSATATPTATPSATATPAPTQTSFRSPDRRSTVQLVAAPLTPAAFPFTPQWTPPGLPAPVVGRNQGGYNLVYEADQPNMLVQLLPVRQVLAFTPVTTRTVQIKGRTATLSTGTSDGKPAVNLTWQLADHRWLDIDAAGLSADQVVRYAENLAPQPFARPLPFTVALLPAGHKVAFQELHPEEFHLCVAPSARLNDDTRYICVSHNQQPTELTSPEAVQVGADRGELSVHDGVVTLVVHRPGFEFIVTERDNGELSNADLIRFAAGVSKAP